MGGGREVGKREKGLFLIPYLPKPLSHFLVSMKITKQTCSKMKCADEDFPKFHP